jgi:hypothetical protein
MTERDLASSPVTTSDGKLVGIVMIQDVGAVSPTAGTSSRPEDIPPA